MKSNEARKYWPIFQEILSTILAFSVFIFLSALNTTHTLIFGKMKTNLSHNYENPNHIENEASV